MLPPQIITQLLVKWGDGDGAALDELMPVVYETLRKLAASYLRRERRNHSLQPEALVNEAYVRLVGQQTSSWQNRTQFFGMAATLMRNILVDYARERMTAKRGGELYRVSLSKANRVSNHTDVGLMALNDALNELAAVKPAHARLVELKFFGGLTIEETAAVMNKSRATVERDWAFARAWLQREMTD
jgi:RNA polymerase sigma factor (TIGR02999 family)